MRTMRRIAVISILLISALSLFFPSFGREGSHNTVYAADVANQGWQWVLVETVINPNLLPLKGTGTGGIAGEVNITASMIDIRYSQEQSVSSYTLRFSPPPLRMNPGETVLMEVSGEVITNRSGFPWAVSIMLPKSKGASLNDKSQKTLATTAELTATKPARLPGENPDSLQMSFVIALNLLAPEGWNDEPAVIWRYRPSDIVEPATTTTQPVATTSSTPGPDKDPIEKAIDSRGSISREEAEKLINNELKSSLDAIKGWLEDVRKTVNEWVDKIQEKPIAWVEGILADKYADDFGGEEPELPWLTWDEVNEQLGERVSTVAGINEESMDELFDKVKNILWEEDTQTGRYHPRRTTAFETVDARLIGGGTTKIGVMVTPEGRILFTTNGEDFYTDLKRAFDPTLRERAGDMYDDTKDWIWDSLFTGSTRNADIDMQNRVASEVLEDLRVQLNAGEGPESLMDWTEGKVWSEIQDSLETQKRQWLWQQAGEALETFLSSEDISLEDSGNYITSFRDLKHQFDGGELTTPRAWAEFKSQTGIDLFDLTESGQYAVTGAEFAMESIKTMARGLQDTDFALRTRAYIKERKAGYNVDAIYQRMRDGELPELNIGTAKAASGGVSSLMASSGIEGEAQMGVMFSMFEQAYQRYLLAKSMGREL